MMQALSKRYGTSFTVRLPFFGPTVIISDPALVKQFFQTRTDVVCNVEPNLDLVLVRARRSGCRTNSIADAASCWSPVSREADAGLRGPRRGGNAQGGRQLARGSGVRGAGIDEPDHLECDLAGRIRRRGRRIRRAAQGHAAVGGTRLPACFHAIPAPRPGRMEPVGTPLGCGSDSTQ